MDLIHLLTPRELDRMLRYSPGRSARLAQRGQVPHITLPDGEVRFDKRAIESWLSEHTERGEVHDAR